MATQEGGDQAAMFAPLTAKELSGRAESRKVSVPAHRYTPMKENWDAIYTPLVEQLGLQVRMNLKKRSVELRVRPCSSAASLLPLFMDCNG